jgi:bifunctional non-homologous end joining protein LigD
VVEIPRSGDAEVEVEGQLVQLTRVERPMWPVAALTKADLLEYYARVAPVLLPHVAGRPLRVVRFPDGVHLRGMVDSEVPPITGLASLLAVVNLAAVELHVPLGPPGAMLFDLLPGAGRSLPDCIAVALRLREMLAADGLTACVKTSGAFGLHVAVPLNGGTDAASAREYARLTAERLASGEPDLMTADARRAARSGRVLVDWRPNAPGRATVAPYSLRAMLPGPGLSAPVSWSDVENATLDLTPDDIDAGHDPWRPVLEGVQTLPD